jgi:hypothetical protein
VSVRQSEKERAIGYLLERVEPKVLRQVYVLRDEPRWWVEQHFNLGLGVRNMLRAGGFGWGDVELDEMWPGLIEAAAVRLVEDGPPLTPPRGRGKENKHGKI